MRPDDPLPDEEARRRRAREVSLNLVALVRDRILTQVTRHVAMLNLPEAAASPYAAAFPTELRPVLTALGERFNQRRGQGLQGQRALMVDASAILRRIQQEPARFGLLDASTPICDAGRIAVLTGGAVTTGSSLWRKSTPGSPLNGLRPGTDSDRFLFADFIHPTTGGHRAFAQGVMQGLRDQGWMR